MPVTRRGRPFRAWGRSAEAAIVEQVAEGRQAEVALADVLVAVDPGAELAAAVV